MAGKLLCWQPLDSAEPCVEQASRLYEATQHPDERIPWEWIAGSIGRDRTRKRGGWSPHLLLAGSSPDIVGFASCAHIDEYGGYLSYIGVDPAARGRGVGTRLIEFAVDVLNADAGGELPFLVWESMPPPSPEEAEGWRARLGLWHRAGAFYVSGISLHAVNYARQDAPPLQLALFLLPVARPAEAFDAEALREVAAGMLREVYGRTPGDLYFERTLPPGCAPSLRPVSEALALV